MWVDCVILMKYKEISVVIPCFNEARTIYVNLERVYSYLAQNFERFEIITVNDGSTDATYSELKRFQEKYQSMIIDRRENLGKGKTVKEGILASQYDPVMFMDADLAIPIQELEKFMEALGDGYDIVIASRFVQGVKVLKPVLWYRKIMENVFRHLRILILNTGRINDTQCGFKVFKRKCAIEIFSNTRINRFAFDSEVIYLAEKMHLRIKELPISLQNPRLSHIRLIRDSANMFFDLIKINLNYYQGKYKISHGGQSRKVQNNSFSG